MSKKIGQIKRRKKPCQSLTFVYHRRFLILDKESLHAKAEGALNFDAGQES